MAAVSLPSKVLGRNVKKFYAFFVKNVFWGYIGGSYSPLCPSAATHMDYALVVSQSDCQVKQRSIDVWGRKGSLLGVEGVTLIGGDCIHRLGLPVRRIDGPAMRKIRM